MHTSISAITILMMVFSASLHAEVDSQAKQLFKRMATASKTLNYEGVFVYSRNGKMDSMRVIHVNNDDGEFEQLTSLNGMSWKVIRQNDKVFCPFPGKTGRGLQHSKLRFTSLNSGQTLSTLEKHYHFKLGNKERVADRICKVLEIDPKDQYRYGYRLWVDMDTGLLMRTDIVNDGKIVEQMMFTSVKFYKGTPKLTIKSKPFSEQQKQIDATGQKNAGQGAIQVEFGPTQPKWRVDLPPGFFLAEHNRFDQSAKDSEHLVFTDGLASISIFIDQKTKTSYATPDAVTQGAINAMALNSDVFNRHITVVGDVPAVTVKKIANTINHRQP